MLPVWWQTTGTCSSPTAVQRALPGSMLRSLERRAVIETGPRPNGVAFVAQSKLAVVACIGDESAGPTLHSISLATPNRWSIEVPGRPRWCVTDAAGTRVFLAVREPSMVLVADLPKLDNIRRWMLPCGGAHGIDIDHSSGRLYVACDGGALVEVDTATGRTINEWPLAGVPDATFFNPSSGLVHVAIDKPGASAVDHTTHRPKCRIRNGGWRQDNGVGSTRPALRVLAPASGRFGSIRSLDHCPFLWRLFYARAKGQIRSEQADDTNYFEVGHDVCARSLHKRVSYACGRTTHA